MMTFILSVALVVIQSLLTYKEDLTCKLHTTPVRHKVHEIITHLG